MIASTCNAFSCPKKQDCGKHRNSTGPALGLAYDVFNPDRPWLCFESAEIAGFDDAVIDIMGININELVRTI